MTNITLNCKHCNCIFQKPLNTYNHAEKRGGNHFCSQQCFHKSKEKLIQFQCTYCTKTFSRTLNQMRKSNNPFCSQSCAAKYNNSNQPKKTAKTHKCNNCNTQIKLNRKFCKKCYNYDYSLSELKLRYYNRSISYIHSVIRNRSRYIGKKLKWKSCRNCGYDKHIEICHIRPISDFSDFDKLSTINNPNNLIPLCPNCHWELDNKILKI